MGGYGMTELDLYKFCNENEMDWRGEKLIMWIYPSDIQELVDLIGYQSLSEGGLEVVICGTGQIAMEVNEICEWFDIDPERIYAKEESA
jgi:hypothetical protein